MPVEPSDSIRNAPKPEEFTGRERQVICLVARGYADKEIAQALGIAESTAKTHLEHVRGRLQMHKRSAVVRYAAYYELFPPNCEHCNPEICTIKPTS